MSCVYIYSTISHSYASFWHWHKLGLLAFFHNFYPCCLGTNLWPHDTDSFTRTEKLCRKCPGKCRCCGGFRLRNVTTLPHPVVAVRGDWGIILSREQHCKRRKSWSKPYNNPLGQYGRYFRSKPPFKGDAYSSSWLLKTAVLVNWYDSM